MDEGISTIRQAASDRYRLLCQRLAALVRGREIRLGRFEGRLRTRWARVLDLLALMYEASMRDGSRFLLPDAGFRFVALRRLHARACLVYSEIHCLLGSGFASGALARWRTLHETAIVARILRDHPDELARKYLDHEHIESSRAARELQKHADVIADELPAAEEVEQLTLDEERLLARYGPDFRRPMGWASELCGAHPPKVALLEKLACLEAWRPIYRMASYGVHAEPKAANWNLASGRAEETLLAGPSNCGVADPAYNAAWSLRDVTASLLSLRRDAEGLTRLAVLDQILEAVWIEAERSHQALIRAGVRTVRNIVDPCS